MNFHMPHAQPMALRSGASRTRNRALYTGIVASLLPIPALAADAALFATTDQNPFIQPYSLPSPSRTAPPGVGGWGMALRVDMSNNALEETRQSGEHIRLDGESYRTTLAVAYQPGERLVLGMELPFVAHTPGMFDSLIREWHSLVGLSNDRQDDFTKYDLSYAWSGSGAGEFALDHRTRALGDVRLQADWPLGTAAPGQRSLVVRAGLKLPTGSVSRLSGSGGTDLSVQLLADDPSTLAAWNTTLGWSVGLLRLGKGELLDDLRRDTVAIGSIGVSRPVWGRITARLQLDGHSGFYDSRLRPLGSASLQLTFGGSLALRRGQLDVAMIENLFTDTTPDVGLHIAWRQGF